MKNTRIVLTPRQLQEVGQLHPTLMEMLRELMMRWPEDTIELSCVGRSWEEDKELGASGIHSAGPPWRAIDVRIRTLGETDEMTPQDQIAADNIADKINAGWLYDPLRPKIEEVISRQHGTGPHIHLQVHPRTRKIDWG